MEEIIPHLFLESVLRRYFSSAWRIYSIPSFKDPVRLIVPFIYGLFFLKSPCHSFHVWTEQWKEDTEVDPVWFQLSCTIHTDVSHNNPWWASPRAVRDISAIFLRSYRELQSHWLLHPAHHQGHQAGCPQCHREDISWLGKQLVLLLLLSQKGSCHPSPCK